MPDRDRRTIVLALFACVALGMSAGATAADDAATDGCGDTLPPGDSPPPTAFTRLADAGEADEHEGADHVIVYERSVNRVKETGVTYTNDYVLYKVLTAGACRNMSVRRWRYEPWSSFIDVREVNVIRGDERIPVDVSNVHDLPAPQSAIYWNARVKTLQLPRLRVNDGIEIVTFRKGYSYALLDDGGTDVGGAGADGFTDAGAASSADAGTARTDDAGDAPDDDKYVPPMPGEYFDIVHFSASVPIIEQRYEVVIPSSKRLHSETYNGPLFASTSYTADSTRYAWWGVDLPARPYEPRQASASDDAPKVVLATVESWEAKSRWFFDVNEGQFAVTPAVQAKVEEIFEQAGLTEASEEEKAAALVHWVAQNIRYSGQTMGEGEGFTLHSGEMIFEQRSGVCKDIAGMLITMMRAAGMDSYGAMTMAGSRIDEVPADQFNHCVCALRQDDGSFEMYDPTWVPYYNEIWSKYETEQQYLVGTSEGEPLATIPFSPAGESPLTITHRAQLSDDGTLAGTFRFEGAGVMDTRLRNVVSGSRMVDVRHDVARLLSSMGDGVEVARYDHPRVDDFSQDMWIEVEYRVPDFALPVDGGLEFRSPMMTVTLGSGWLFRAGASEWDEERETELFLWFTQLLEGTETIRLPDGYAVDEPPTAEEIDETYASFEGGSEMDGRDLVVTQRARVKRRQIPPDGYGGFKKAIDEAREWGDALYRVEKGGDR